MIASPDIVQVNRALAAENERLRKALQLWLDYDNCDDADFSGITPMLSYAEAIDATRTALAHKETV